MDNIRKEIPQDVSLEVVYDNSGVIRTSTHAVLEHLILGAALAAIIVLVFLAARGAPPSPRSQSPSRSSARSP